MNKWILTIIGAIIFLAAIVCQAFLDSIIDSVVSPQIEVCSGKVVDYYKDRSVEDGKYGNKHITYYTSLDIDIDGEIVHLNSGSPDMYKNVKRFVKINVYKYKDKYSLSEEEFRESRAAKIVIYFFMALGAVIASIPFLDEADRVNPRSHSRHSSW